MNNDRNEGGRKEERKRQDGRSVKTAHHPDPSGLGLAQMRVQRQFLALVVPNMLCGTVSPRRNVGDSEKRR